MPPWKTWARRLISVVLFVIVLASALSAGLLAAYISAAKTASIPLLTFLAVVLFAFLMWMGAAFCSAIWGGPTRVSAMRVSGLFAVLFVVLLYFGILRPYPGPIPDVVAYANTKYWQLPTGSLIAYSEYDPPAGVAIRPEAIVYLHGGPGVRQAPFDQEIYGGFSVQGFRVFLYDQAGSGLSGFLVHISDYTMERSVEDLEAVRRKIAVEKMILIGHSWGSTLAASYMAKYPGHVAKVVFHSPGRIWRLQDESYDFSRTAGRVPILLDFKFRLLAALLLRDRNRQAAENLVSQKEAEMLWVPTFRTTLGTVVCRDGSSKLPHNLITALDGHEDPGVNPYVLQELVSDTQKSEGDPHSALRGNHTPAILLYPECNYLSWAGGVDYKKTFPNLKIYYIPHAGHYIQFEQPELLKRVILAFLLDQPDAISPYTADGDPRSENR